MLPLSRLSDKMTVMNAKNIRREGTMTKPREVKFVGVNMKPGEDTFKVPDMPGWKLVSVNRQPFGAALLFEKVEEDK